MGSPLFFCACIVGTPVCVSFMLDAGMPGSSIRAVICRCVSYMFPIMYFYSIAWCYNFFGIFYIDFAILYIITLTF